jgi:phytanoyl-CoA hydroxylase
MSYPEPSADDVAFFRQHGYLIVENAVDPADLSALLERCNDVLERKDELAHDWAWDAGSSLDSRKFRIVQANISLLFPDFLPHQRVRDWEVRYASALMGMPIQFWYDQFLAKPPRDGAATPWHQDEGYWGRNLADQGITCWIPFHDVPVENGCMHFIDGGHLGGILPHHRPDNVKSDMLTCEPDESRTIACPVKLGSVTFHHSKTPHMTTGNTAEGWRKIITQHMKHVNAQGEGDHYEWRIFVDQKTGEERRPAGAEDRDARWAAAQR